MMIDVDRFKAEDVGPRAMRRLAEYNDRPMWLDQDAINDVLGNEWLGLDRRWNFFHAADPRRFSLADYESADVIHFAGGKPADTPDHPAISIYDEHSGRVERKLVHRPEAVPVNRVFAATCCEVLLGQQRAGDVRPRADATLRPSEFVGNIIGSAQFRSVVIEPLMRGLDIPHDRFVGRPSLAQRYWAADRLPMMTHSARRVEIAETWIDLLSPLLEDRHFMRLGGMAPLNLPARVVPVANPPRRSRPGPHPLDAVEQGVGGDGDVGSMKVEATGKAAKINA